MTRKEIQKEISRLQVMLREAEEQEREQHRERARKFVGKCYKSIYGDRFKIIGVPRTRLLMTGVAYNKYQFPAIFLQYAYMPREQYICDETEFAPCYYDEVNFNIDSLDTSIYQETTSEEFNAEFDKCIKHFKEQINV